MSSPTPTPLLDVRNLRTHFMLDHGVARAVDGVSFSLNAGECLALVGESGCGKSVTSLSIMRLLNSPPAKNAGGEILFEGQDLLKISEQEMTLRRGKDMAMIFQEPQSALNPVFPVGEQVAEAYRIHNPKCSAKEAQERAVEALRIVGIPDPGTRANDHPHQLSGGMKQRVCIAMGLICSPKLLIADEPTTALDVTIQAQILELLRSLQKERGLALLLITHDLGVVAEMAERTCVMYAGKIVETAPTRQLFAKPLHPYTQGLLRARPRPGSSRELTSGQQPRLAEIPGMVPTATKFGDDCRFRARCPLAIEACSKEPPLEAHGEDSHQGACWRAGEDAAVAWEQLAANRVPTTTVTVSKEHSQPLIEVKELRKHFELSSGWFGKSKQSVKAVSDISFSIGVGETLGLVGESGCGKTTAGRTLLQLIPPSGGQVRYKGEQLTGLTEQQLRPYRREMQIIFQDPFSSLNPRLTVEQIIAEGLNIHTSLVPPGEIRPRVLTLLQKVGLPADALRRYPHEFSGGQRQRIGIARALAVNPRFIVCDEAVSALDVSVQAQIINLLMDLQAAEGLSYLFIAHDLSVVEHISHRVAVMYLGHLVEIAPTRELFSNPKHPYTRALLSAVPKRSPADLKERQILKGEPPSPIHPPPGCPFAPRCPLAQPSCSTQLPALTPIENEKHWVRCPITQ